MTKQQQLKTASDLFRAFRVMPEGLSDAGLLHGAELMHRIRRAQGMGISAERLTRS